MNKLKTYLVAAVAISSLVFALTVSGARANNTQVSTVSSSTAHFSSGNTYLFTPENGGRKRKCKVTAVDGVWVGCEGSSEWVNTNAMIFAEDTR